MMIFLVLTFITHGVVNHEEHVAPSWDTCVRWRREVRSQIPDHPGVAVITGCEWRLNHGEEYNPGVGIQGVWQGPIAEGHYETHYRDTGRRRPRHGDASRHAHEEYDPPP